MNLLQPDSPELWATAAALVREYASTLGFDLGFQDFDAEIGSFSAHYGPPHGVFIVALDANRAVACGGIRRLSATTCEMKRLYVHPSHRSVGVGRRVAERLIAGARELGYERMLLDTVPSMERAHALYGALGFTQVEAYCANPVPGATFWSLAL